MAEQNGMKEERQGGGRILLDGVSCLCTRGPRHAPICYVRDASTGMVVWEYASMLVQDGMDHAGQGGAVSKNPKICPRSRS